MNDKERTIMLGLINYWRQQNEKLKENTKEALENLKKQFENHEEEQKKLEMMREHPEWFETISPKEYGMKLMKCKNKRK